MKNQNEWPIEIQDAYVKATGEVISGYEYPYCPEYLKMVQEAIKNKKALPPQKYPKGAVL